MNKQGICLKIAGYIALLLFVPSVGAYTPSTHRSIADAAILNSSLVGSQSSPSVLSDWGLSAIGDPSQLFPNPEQGESIETIRAQPANTVQDLIDDGAAFEDLGVRSVNHFYDPVNGAPLTLNLNAPEMKALSLAGIAYPFLTSPDWALKDGLADDPNLYTVKDINDYLYRAMTSELKADRDAAFGLTFDSLGHVLHHIGDMAQPQHVRNDMHCDLFIICGVVGLYNPSRYETYAAAQNGAGQLPMYGYQLSNPADFKIARDFWYNGADKGIAQFTNQNFISQGTNFTTDSNGNVAPASGYPSPVPSAVTNVSYLQVFAARHAPVSPAIQQACGTAAGACQVAEYGTNITDNESGTTTVNPYAASFSIFDQDLKASQACLNAQNGGPLPPSGCDAFALSDINYQNDLSDLIPRAVGYSVGLINYIFRGRLDVQYDPSTAGSYIVTNKSAYNLNGTLEIYYDATDGKRYPVPGFGQPDISLDASCTGTCNDSKSAQIPALPAGSPTPSNPGEYMFVFNGVIGTEAGVAAKLFSPNRNVYVAQNIQYRGTYFIPLTQQPNSAIEYQADGTKVTTDQLLNGYVNAPFDIAVYNKTIYTDSASLGVDTVVNAYSYPGYGSGNHKVILNVRANCGSQTACGTGNGIAVNDNSLFVPTYIGNELSDTTAYAVSVFDHSGNATGSIPEQYYTSSISANDRELCVASEEWAGHPIAELVQLQDFGGNVLSGLMTIPLDGTFAGAWCASTADRQYVLIQKYDSNYNVLSTAYIYDNSGQLITTFPITGPSSNAVVWGIAADGGHLYLAYTGEPYFGNVGVFNKITINNSDGSTSESYQLAPDIALGAVYGGIAVDMATVLNGPP